MTTLFQQLIQLPNPQDYKVHLASWNKEEQPLDVFARNRSDWHDWNRWRYSRDDYNRQFVFSMIDIYREPDSWFFGGIYEILSRSPENHAHSYTIKLTDQFADLIGRLKIGFSRPGRAQVLKLENYVDLFELREILREPYAGETFPGLSNICHDFGMLATIYSNHRPDWFAALSSVKGIYVLADKKRGKHYVGSAYSDGGVWARWNEYIENGHGGNTKLIELIKTEGFEYFQSYFRFALIEYSSSTATEAYIKERENYWKDVFLSRHPHGYNDN